VRGDSLQAHLLLLLLLLLQGRMHQLSAHQLSRLAAALAKGSAGRPHLLQELAEAAADK
jgi:hypothetical protein